MDDLFAFLLLVSLVLLVIGIFNPKTSLFWYAKERTKKKSAMIYGGLTILFFILFGAVTDAKKENKSENTTQKSAVVEPQKSALTQAQKDSIIKEKKEKEVEEIRKNTISAPNLTAFYEANEVNADKNFKGRRFYVTGTVTDIKKDVFDKIYVQLRGDQMFREVQCYFNDEDTASELQKGMKVTFMGTCDGLMMNVLMKNCVMVENPK